MSKERITGSDNMEENTEKVGYRPTEDIVQDDMALRILLKQCERDIADLKRKYGHLAEFAEFWVPGNPPRQTWLMSQSRFRKAKVYDFLAVLLMLATMAALGCALVLLSAPAAKAEPIDPVAVSYAAVYADAVCGTLSDFPNLNGVLGLISAIRDDGLTAGQAGAAIGLSVAEACPRFEPLLEAFIARYGSVAA